MPRRYLGAGFAQVITDCLMHDLLVVNQQDLQFLFRFHFAFL